MIEFKTVSIILLMVFWILFQRFHRNNISNILMLLALIAVNGIGVSFFSDSIVDVITYAFMGLIALGSLVFVLYVIAKEEHIKSLK